MPKFRLFPSRRLPRLLVNVKHAGTQKTVYEEVERRFAKRRPVDVERRRPLLYDVKRAPVTIRTVGRKEVDRLKFQLAKKIQRSGKSFTSVVAIARGGLEIGMELADSLGLPLIVVGYQRYGRGKVGAGKNKRRKVPTFAVKGDLGSYPLLVDDLADEGKTLRSTKQVLLRKRGVQTVSTAVLFAKPHTRFRPDFSIAVTGDWLVFPWEKKEFNALLRAPSPAQSNR